MGYGSMDWIELAQDRNRLRALCECGKEISGSKNARNFVSS